jgi:RNA-directed DNA polymerase
MKDRAMEALYLLALDPVAETTADLNSYGFRQDRSTADAIQQCFIILSKRKVSPDWILEGDIRACFDKISHDWLLANIPIEKAILCKWLKAGYIEKRAFHPTEEGTPQGGIISPALMNLVLDGLEQELQTGFVRTATSRPMESTSCDTQMTSLLQPAQRLLENQVRPFVEQFMNTRGLVLSTEKTCITHIDNGFDFLGQNMQIQRKAAHQACQKNVRAFLTKIRCLIKDKTVTAGDLISRLNPVIRGWANYHQHVCSSQTYRRADAAIFKALWRWAKRRHSNKGSRWVRQKYFKTLTNRHWVFSGEVAGKDDKPTTIRLISATYISIRRHIKIRGKANPYDPAWEMYFEDRQNEDGSQVERKSTATQPVESTEWSMPRCGHPITPETGWHLHHIIWKSRVAVIQ